MRFNAPLDTLWVISESRDMNSQLWLRFVSVSGLTAKYQLVKSDFQLMSSVRVHHEHFESVTRDYQMIRRSIRRVQEYDRQILTKYGSLGPPE